MKKSILTIGLMFLTFGAFASHGLVESTSKTVDGNPPRKVHRCIGESVGPAHTINNKFIEGGYESNYNRAYMAAFKNCLKRVKGLSEAVRKPFLIKP